MLTYITTNNEEYGFNALNTTVIQKITGDYTLSFDVLNEPNIIEEMIIRCDNQLFRIKQMDETMFGEQIHKSVNCKHITHDLIDYYEYDSLTNTLTLVKALEFVFKNTPFTFSIVGSVKNQSFENLGNMNKQSLLNKIIEKFGVEYTVDNYHFTFKPKIGVNTEFQFRYKANISDTKKTIDTTSLTTYIKATGKCDENGEPMVSIEYTSPNAEKFGIRHASPISDERFTIEAELIEYAKSKLNDEPSIAVSLKYQDLNAEQHLNIGDYGYLIHEPLDLDIKSRIIEIKTYPESTKPNEYTIGSTTFIRSSFETGNNVNNTIGIEFPDYSGDIQNAYEQAVQDATNKINDGLGGYVVKRRDELLIMDDEDVNKAKNLWRWNLGGLGFSSNGYSGPYQTALTSDGKINADRILAGTVDGALIRANTIKANSLEISTVQKINSAITADDATAIMNTHLEVYDGNIKAHINTVTESKIEGVNDSISVLVGRVSSVESKITDDAITNTVKQSFYTKQETENAITNKGYQTSSEVQQTVDKFQIKFSENGGCNLLRNGGFEKGTDRWGRNGNFTDGKDVWAPYGYGTSWVIWSSGGGTGFYQFFDCVGGRRYSWSIDVFVETGGVQVGIEGVDTRWQYASNGWVKLSGNFIANGTGALPFIIYTVDGGATFHMDNAIVNEGEIPLPYSPHPSEIYDGITTIDRDGIDVATSYGAHTQFHAGGMSSYNNSNQRTLGIENGGISFHSWNNNALSAYITQSSLWGGSQSSNGLAISTTANGTYLALGTSSLSDVNTTLNMDQALTISAGDSFQPKGLNFWKDVHAHGYGIRQLSHLKLAGSGAIQFDYLNNSPSTIYEAVDNGHSLYVMGGYQLHLGCMDGSGSPKGVIWMRDSNNTHSYTHWDFHNYTMYNMRTASTYANYDTRRTGESYGVTSNVDGVRYLYKNVELVNGKAIRSIPLEYKGCKYDIVSIVCKGRGNAWVEMEDENRFEINGDCKSVNIEIIIYPSEAVMTASTQQLEEAPTLELPKKIEPEEALLITNEAI